MGTSGFNSVVAARTRAADQILSTPDLLEGFLKVGGLARDLETVRQAGTEAEAANLSSSQTHSSGKAATLNVLLPFSALQHEYSAVMGVVCAVRADVARNGGSPELLTRLDGIIVNEAQLTVKVVTDESGAKSRKAKRSATQEALRAEIAKDAGALIALTEVHAALEERRVPLSRLTLLLQAATALTGKLADRATAKGAGKDATKVVRAAVALQKDAWGGAYRLLAALGARDARVRALLVEASAG